MSGWQPIETGPRDETLILLWAWGEYKLGFWGISPDPYKFEGWTTGWRTVSGYDVGFDPIGDATHWMPLPEPPLSIAAGSP